MNSKIIQALRKDRKARGYSRSAQARRLDLAESTIRTIEAGANPRRLTLKALAAALGVEA